MPKLIFITILFLAGCGEKNEVVKKEIPVTQVWDSSYIINKPALFMGTDFGRFFQQLYKQAQWKEMLRYTCSSSRARLSDDSLLSAYSKMDFG